jgi:hypothetical protein
MTAKRTKKINLDHYHYPIASISAMVVGCVEDLRPCIGMTPRSGWRSKRGN